VWCIEVKCTENVFVMVRQARFDADPTKLKGKVPRPSAKKYHRRDEGDSEDDFDEVDDGDDEGDFDDEDSEGGDDDDDDDGGDDDQENASSNVKGKLAQHERDHQRKTPAAEAREANNTRLPIKLASGRIVQPTAKLEKQGQLKLFSCCCLCCVFGV